MELSDPATPAVNGATDRRKSGRSRQKPVLLNKDPNIPRHVSSSGAKRKRAESRVENVSDPTDDDMDDESNPEESDPDDEELKERRRRKSRNKKTASRPAPKKPKTVPALITNLAVRPAANGVKRVSKAKQARARPVTNVADDGTGLYAEVFSQGHTLDAVAADWIKRWEQNNSEAMCYLINFVIRCTGCNLTIDVHDINDPDNAVSKLTDLQDEYQAQKITEYPLISKAKGNSSFRASLTGFFETLIATCHAAGLLYSDEAITENLEVWVSTMSSSAIRPFRHTATVISLAIGTALCNVANDLTENTAKMMRQKEGEQKKKNVNKGRVKEFDDKVKEGERRRARIVESLQAIFDTVFVHRYRDVDPKIRVECVSALGTWVATLPDVFFEGIYLRYLGWVLSDTFAPTRAEVVKQLHKLFKNRDNVARLRQFTERFRGRLVEMSVQDSEVSIRAAAVELLDVIRETGLLEPDDIDAIGRLIFDSEHRVRKAVAGFFAENINDLFENTVEDFGGEEALGEILGEEVEENYDTPRRSWLKLKCVAEALQSYDAEDPEDDQIPRIVDSRLLTGGIESRYALAAQTIYEGVPEAKDWEALAGYLLYDFSTADQDTEGSEATFESRCKLSEREEILLLETLNASVKGRLLEAVDVEMDKKGKKSNRQKEESRAVQEEIARHLATVIRPLLKKFGSTSTTASAVLRLEHVLNLEIFQELRQNSTTYASLLEDINEQFLTHTDQNVLAEASTALLHARAFEDLEEITEGKLLKLWDGTVSALRSMIQHGIEHNVTELCNTAKRVANLASISDCTDAFEYEPSTRLKAPKAKATESPENLLMRILQDPALGPEAGEEADELLISTMKALLFYHMWKVRSIQNAITSGDDILNVSYYAPFSLQLADLIGCHHKTSTVRLAATGALLDLHTLFAVLRHTEASSDQLETIADLVQHIPDSAQALVLSTYTALEKSFAKKSRKTLEAAPDDDLASDPEDSSDEEDEDENIQQETLVAEKQLCELAGKMVLAIVARVLDHDGPKKGKIKERLQRNKMKLGSNFKEVLAYLDGPKVKAKKGRSKKKVSKPVVDEDQESEDEPQHEEGGEEDLRERELVEDRIVDPDDDGDEEDARPGADEVEDDDDIMGD
ncbi:cohesin complex subunit SA-1/2, partial [Lecanoromycetidae sp. Uapishka_2]